MTKKDKQEKKCIWHKFERDIHPKTGLELYGQKICRKCGLERLGYTVTAPQQEKKCEDCEERNCNESNKRYTRSPTLPKVRRR